MSDSNGTVEELRPHREIAEFIAEGLANGDRVVLISTREGRREIEERLADLGIPPASLERDGSASWFDSDDVLRRVVIDGLPDPVEFEQVMHRILFRAFVPAPGQRIRAYHDLVDLLRERLSLDAAVLLLRMWTSLCARYEELLLAYTVAELYREKDCTV